MEVDTSIVNTTLWELKFMAGLPEPDMFKNTVVLRGLL